MKFEVTMQFLSLFAMYSTQTVQYWNPLEPVINHFKTETTRMQIFVDEKTNNAKSFIEDQTTKMKKFAETQKSKLENALFSSLEEAKKAKSYIQEQHKIFSDEINNYVEGVKESREIKVDKDMKFDKKASRLVYPEMILSVPSIIVKNGYLCETHTVQSQGYILNIHRIPKGKHRKHGSSKTILLQHGIFASSADWILNGPEKGLAYVLADAGYDVWMTNIRGNKYSREHAWLKVDTKEYWNFSWHEVAQHDIPEIIDYIIKIKGTNTKIAYIGHSMGTTILFAMLTLRPEYNDILSAGIALAPVAFMGNIKSPLKSLASIASNIAYMEMLYGSHEFVPKHSVLGKLYSSCDVNNNQADVCKNALFYICGQDAKQFNKTLLPVFISNLGTGTSWKTAVHFAQEIIAGGRFQKFDYGYYKNLKKYGSSDPPEYDLNLIKLPLTLFWAKNDLLSDEKDVKKLYEHLPKSTEMYEVPFADFNHLDYLWAVDADVLVNDKILKTLKKVFEVSHIGFSLFDFQI